MAGRLERSTLPKEGESAMYSLRRSEQEWVVAGFQTQVDGILLREWVGISLRLQVRGMRIGAGTVEFRGFVRQQEFCIPYSKQVLPTSFAWAPFSSSQMNATLEVISRGWHDVNSWGSVRDHRHRCQLLEQPSRAEFQVLRIHTRKQDDFRGRCLS